MHLPALHCTALHCTALHCTALHCTALHCTALHCTALHCTALHCTALHCTALHCTNVHCSVLHCSNAEIVRLHGLILKGNFWRCYESFVKLAFEMHESTELGLLKVRKILFCKLLRCYKTREAGF